MDAFELVDTPEDGQSTYSWKPTFWRPYPVGKDYKEELHPWQRPEQARISFVDVNIIDVQSASILPNRTVKIESGLIVSITKSRAVDMQEDSWISVDCKGLYMCPGLIDCHVHILASMGEDPTDVGQFSVPMGLKGMLYNGFTTVRDVGGADRSHRQATQEWLIPGPRLFIGGPVLSQTGGHGGYRYSLYQLTIGDHSDRDIAPSPQFISSSGDPAWNKMAILVDGGETDRATRADETADACLKATRKLMMAGADHVKICTSGGVLSPTDRLDSSQFTVPEIRAVCDTVKMMGGTLVTSHCNTDAGARNAIEGGVGGIEHGGLLSDDTLRLMAKKGIHYTPTLIIQDMIVNGPLAKTVPPFSLEKAKLIEANTYKVIKRAHELGVNIAYGTDCFVPFQLAEFDLRAKVLPGSAILQQATCNAAKVVGMEGKLGVVRQGAFADLLLLKDNPLNDISIMNKPNQYLMAVIKDGRCVRSSVNGLRVEVDLTA